MLLTTFNHILIPLITHYKRMCVISVMMICHFSFAQIMIAEPSKDMGEIFESKGNVSTTFTLSNPYKNDTIHILDIQTSCGCTAILTQDTLILPLSKLDIEVSYDPKGRLGLFMKSIAIVSRTGNNVSTLYLNITGNVISETVQIEPQNSTLQEYKVIPIYFYPITAFDTSYLDFSYIIPFINDLTYEIDFYQFTTVGFEIAVRDKKYIEDLEYLLLFSKNKIIREFKRRGYFPNTIFFDQPVFIYDEIPDWSVARVKVHSSNFNSDIRDESVIKVSTNEVVEDLKLALNYERFSLPSTSEIIQEVNFDMLEGKLFMNTNLQLRGMILTPPGVYKAEQNEIKLKLEKALFKELKKRTGISKEDVTISFDSLGLHSENKYLFMLWDLDDVMDQQQFKFELKRDSIVPPLLPTYKQMNLADGGIDTNHADFKQMWKNLLLNNKLGFPIELLLEVSVSRVPRSGSSDNLDIAKQKAKLIADFLMSKFKRETGKSITIESKTILHGPEYQTKLSKLIDYSQFDYFNIVPLTHKKGNFKELEPHPYQVNFDYYFKGVDTASWLFNKFANYLAAAVEQDGYVELRLESSISKIPIEHDLPNDYLVFIRALESEKRMRQFVKQKLTDPNRIIISEQRYLTQGPEYNGTIPIIQYRKFQYIKIVPQKSL